MPPSSLVLALFLQTASAEEIDLETIIAEAQETRQVDNSIQKVRMVLVSRSGNERVREFEARVKTEGDVVKSWTRFSHPSDVAGTQLVLVDNPNTADAQLLYLPALQRVNRIAGKARKGSFMGSDFAYEDLEVSGLQGARHTLIEDTDEHWVIDSIPGEGSSYSKMRSTVTKADKVPARVEFYDTKGALLKVLTVEETAREGAVVLPTRSTMNNVQKGTQTRLEVLEHRLDVPATEIPDETFTSAFMERNG